ncbi:MAG TPA: response regulator [Acidobacteriota bacterium]
MIVRCPNCLTRYKVNTSNVSKPLVKVQCPSCEKTLVVNVKKMSDYESEQQSANPIRAKDILSDTSVRLLGDVLTVNVNGKQEAPLVLIADEPRAFRSFLRKSLEEMGCRVIVLDDGSSTEEYLRVSETPHVAFLNVVLQNVMGFELCEKIRGNPKLKKIKIVLIGAIFRIDRFRRNPANLYGADDYIEEFIVRQDLRERMRKLLGLPLIEETGDDAAGGRDLVEHAQRLARIILSDILLYNLENADRWILEDKFRTELAAEIQEGEQYFLSKITSDRPEIPEIYHHTIDEYLRKRKRELAQK